MAMTPEAKMKKRVDTVLKEAGVWYFSPQSGIYGSSGIPDRIACVKGRMVGVEVKSGPTKKPTALQAKTMRDMTAAGALCFVVNSEVSLAGFAAWLQLEMT